MVEHQGEIVSIDDGDVVVRMGAGVDECAGCVIAAFCSRPVEVKVAPVAGAEPGAKVLLSANAPLRSRAILLLVAVPLALLVAVLVACALLGLPQWACGLAPLGTLAVWYAIVGLTVGRKVRFRIEKLL
ncbi:MAG: SoxR reducing system RseC family protein [Muribaculaceae bacterium]|nr:SoxR reducing system RseC family protein [Muribaculaceae bacterium]